MRGNEGQARCQNAHGKGHRPDGHKGATATSGKAIYDHNEAGHQYDGQQAAACHHQGAELKDIVHDYIVCSVRSVMTGLPRAH